MSSQRTLPFTAAINMWPRGVEETSADALLSILDLSQQAAVRDYDSKCVPSAAASNFSVMTLSCEGDPITQDASFGSWTSQPDFQWTASMYWQETAVHESTTPCSEAYMLITQQNYKGLGENEIASRISHGFRSSRPPGEGCHVRTDVLFCLLAFISET